MYQRLWWNAYLIFKINFFIVQFFSNYPWYYIILCFVAGIILAASLYVKDKKNNERSKQLVILLFTLRFLSVSIISLLLLDVFIQHHINETEKPIIIIAQDNSTSIISGKDSTDIKTKYLNDLNDFVKSIKEKYDVKLYQFDSDSKPSELFDFKGKETDISKFISNVENNYSNNNIGAVVLATDGIYNKGTNPIYSAQRINAPFYTLALGDTTPICDAWIQTINHNQIAYIENQFPLEVVVNSTDLKNKSMVLSVSENGKILKQEKIEINNTAFSKTINMVLDANKIGIEKFTVSLSVLNEDKNPNNNTQSFIIDVIDNRQKILLLSNAPHPDIAALQESINSTQTYDLEVALVSEFQKTLKPYSLIILHQTNGIAPHIIDEIKANKQSVFYIGLHPPLDIFNISTSNNGNRFNEAEANINNDFNLFSISNELKNYSKEFPAVTCNFGNVNTSPASYSLYNQRIGVVNTNTSLFLFTEINGLKTACFLGDGLWRWSMRDFLDHDNHILFNELINKSVQYLSVKADKSFFKVFSKKIVNENEVIDFTAEVYNQSYELITEPDVSLVLKDSKNKVYNYTFSKKETMYQLSIGQFPAGEYTFEAKVKVGDKFFSKSGVVVVKEIISEKINTVANHQILYQLSKESGGKLFYKNQFAQLQKEILENKFIKNITYTHKELTDIINLRWIFFIVLGLLSLEWFLRKRNGSV